MGMMASPSGHASTKAKTYPVICDIVISSDSSDELTFTGTMHVPDSAERADDEERIVQPRLLFPVAKGAPVSRAHDLPSFPITYGHLRAGSVQVVYRVPRRGSGSGGGSG
jgi:hypothetical protein